MEADGCRVIFLDPQLNADFCKSAPTTSFAGTGFPTQTAQAAQAAQAAQTAQEGHENTTGGEDEVGVVTYVGGSRILSFIVTEDELMKHRGRNATSKVCPIISRYPTSTLLFWTPRFTPFDDNHRTNFLRMAKEVARNFVGQVRPEASTFSPPNTKRCLHSMSFRAPADVSGIQVHGARLLLVSTKKVKFE